jgi:type II secretory pathway predicted ATPase ExeA
MYVEHFSLVKRPFSRVPSANGCVMYPGIKSCFERASEGIRECSGTILIVGSSGSGKSTLLALLEHHFGRELTTITLNCATIDSRHELIQCLLFELGLPLDSDNVGELRLKLIDHLKSPEQCPSGLLLLVDEAHNLPMDVLEELRMITNLVCGSQHHIRLVIAGGRSLEEKLAHPQLESFSQRIAVRCYLQGMSRTETMFFVLAQLQMCGRDGREIFQPSALEKIYDITDGVPRLVAHLADHVLKMASQNNHHLVDARLVQQAWLDLQQLPAPPDTTELETASHSSIIEFGSLDETAGSSPESADAGPLAGPDLAAAADTTGVPDTGSAASLPPAHIGQIRSWAEAETPLAEALPGENQASDEEAGCEMDLPMECSLDSLLQHLDQIDRELAGENPPAESRAASPHTVDSVEAAAHREPPHHGSGQPAETSAGYNPASEAAPSSDQESWEDATGAVAASSSNDDAESRLESPGEAIDTKTAVPDDGTSDAICLPRQVSADDLFGTAFDDERVVDVQSSLLAEQNRVSSGLTSPEVASLTPVNPECGKNDASMAGPGAETAGQGPAAGPQPLHSGPAAGTHEPSTVAGGEITSPRPAPTAAEDAGQSETTHYAADDSDILIVDHTSSATTDEDLPTDTAPAQSRGRVIRMNYEDLFQQLRNQGSQSQT